MKSFYIKLFSMVLIACLGVIIYSNSFLCSFHFDDDFFITENLAIRNIFQIQDIWNFLPVRFLLYLSFAFNYHLHQLDVFGYHIFNLAVHIISAILVWWFALLTLSTPALREHKITHHSHVIALLAGLIFVAHPIQTQAVTYIIQRAASMATLFYLASLCCYVQSRLLQEKKSGAYGVGILYGVACLMALMAMFTKEIAITLPIIFLFYEFSFLRGKKRIHWKSLAPFLLMIFVIPLTLVLFKAVNAHELKNAVEGATDISLTQYILTQLRVLITYVRLLIAPYNQNVDYDYPVFNSFLEWPVIAGALFLIAILFCAQRAFFNYRLISFSIVWFLVTLLPESSLFPMKDVIFEHRLYLPMVGYSLFLVSGVYYVIGNKSWPIMIIFLSAVIGGYSFLTYQRNLVWKDEFSLWDDVVQKSPGKARPYNNRGVEYFKKNLYAQALSDYAKAAELDPHYADAYNNLGSTYNKFGNTKEALKHYDRAIEIEPNDPSVYCHRAATYLRQNDFSAAIVDYNKAIELDPKLAKAYTGRGLVYTKQKLFDQALADHNKAIALDPLNIKSYINRGISYGAQGQLSKAMDDFNKAIAMDPKDVDIYRSRGVIYYEHKDFKKALEDYQKAIDLDSQDADVFYNRSVILQGQGQLDLALADLNKAIELNPLYAQAYDNRGVIYDSQGRQQEAIVNYNQSIKINQSSKPYNNRGIVYGKQGDFEKAIADFNQAIKLDPRNAQAFYNRGLLYLTRDQLKEALDDYNQALVIDPQYGNAYNDRGSVYLKQNKLKEAKDDFDRFLELNPKDTRAYNNRGIIYARQGLYEQAIVDFNKALELNPKSAESIHNIGLIYFHQSKFDLALEHFNKAIEINPKYSEAYFNRAMAYYQLKQYDQAWADVHSLEQLGQSVNPEFLKALQGVSIKKE